MKVGISVTLDVECIRWLEKQPAKKSALVNEMVWNYIKEGIKAPEEEKTRWYCRACDSVQRHPNSNQSNYCMNNQCERYFLERCEEWSGEE